jgi:hypothetical protein
LIYYLANSPRSPPELRAEVASWGACRDEWPETGGFPAQIYVREARRMVSDYVMTQSNCLGQVTAPDSIALASYNMDSHNCQRIVKDGWAINEGDVQLPVPQPFPISYRAIVPRAGECANLLVPFCLSSSHVAFCSVRMEPVFMMVSQSAATAAALAIDDGVPVQKVNYARLEAKLVSDAQILEWQAPGGSNKADGGSPTGQK